eukprot:SAG11_NODE_611_length_8216_cov_4.843661_4_plen_558_part_00
MLSMARMFQAGQTPGANLSELKERSLVAKRGETEDDGESGAVPVVSCELGVDSVGGVRQEMVEEEEGTDEEEAKWRAEQKAMGLLSSDEEGDHEQEEDPGQPAKYQEWPQEQTILVESEAELEVQMGAVIYLVDLVSAMVFQIDPALEDPSLDVGTWDAENRCIVFSEGTRDKEDLIAMRVSCPEGCGAGDLVTVTTEWGEELEVVVPDGVQPREDFDVSVLRPPEVRLEVAPEEQQAAELELLDGASEATLAEQGGEGASSPSSSSAAAAVAEEEEDGWSDGGSGLLAELAEAVEPPALSDSAADEEAAARLSARTRSAEAAEAAAVAERKAALYRRWRCGWCGCDYEKAMGETGGMLKAGPKGVDSLCGECGAQYAEKEARSAEARKNRQAVEAQARADAAARRTAEEEARQAKAEALAAAKVQLLQSIAVDFGDNGTRQDEAVATDEFLEAEVAGTATAEATQNGAVQVAEKVEVERASVFATELEAMLGAALSGDDELPSARHARHSGGSDTKAVASTMGKCSLSDAQKELLDMLGEGGVGLEDASGCEDEGD